MAHWLKNAIGRPTVIHNVHSADEYVQTVKSFLLRVGLPPVITESPHRPRAYVSAGRWVVDCGGDHLDLEGNPCRNGPSASPEWGIAVCLLSGTLYRPIFPRNWRDAEEELLRRPYPMNRHYFPTDDLAQRYGKEQRETVAELRRERLAEEKKAAQAGQD